jgi:hypothetical protein
MNGPINKARHGASFWPGWLERTSILFGLIVVAGLALESGPDIVAFIEHHIPLPRSLKGEALVTIGVFGEVAISLFIARSARKQEIESELSIAELNNETARLKLLSAYRTIGDIGTFIEAMRPFKGTKYHVDLLLESQENSRFHWELTNGLSRAGWIAAGIDGRDFRLPMGIVIYTMSERGKVKPRSPAGEALAEWLDSRSIAVVTGVSERYEREFDLEIVIGPRPETIEDHELIRSSFAKRNSRPVTPPQA